MDKIHWHRHLGVYGICLQNGKLLVIHKKGGPYTGRHDLPGGSIEPNETVLDAIHREFMEETGITISVSKNLGMREFVVPWTRAGYEHTHVHHVAIFCSVEYIHGDVKDSPNFDDSAGAVWSEMKALNVHNSSPLVVEAMNWYHTKELSINPKIYSEWTITIT
jgi:ADP-ribose pyrophosphatase YjhB (NUDIX family)